MKVTHCYRCGKLLDKPVEKDFYDVFCSQRCEKAYRQMIRLHLIHSEAKQL